MRTILQYASKRVWFALTILLLSSIHTYSFGISKNSASESATSPEFKVSGKVTDVESGVGLPGVTVMVKGSSEGTITNADGNYSISLTDESATLLFSFVGYTPQEITVGGRTQIDVVLTPDVSTLEEVVLVGYGTQRKKDLTGSVASAPLESFQEAPNTNILQSLSGSVAGVSVGQSQFAGGEPDIQIRGRSTINGNDNPLIILDGVVYRGRIGDLNPKDIKSIDILKDASSKAVYGAQAANGVVIITTKSGRTAKKPVINYSTYYAVQTPANELSTYDREGFLRKARDVVWFSDDPANNKVGHYLGPDYTQANPAWNDADHIPFTKEQLDGYNSGSDFNWYDEVTNPGHIQDHQLSLQSGSEKTNYYISGGYTDQVGWIINDKFKRYTGRINIDTDVTDWLTIGANTFGSFSDLSGQSPALNTLPMMSPLAAPRDENGELIVVPMGSNISNPFLIAQTDDLDKIKNVSAIFFADLKIPMVKGLSHRVNFSNNYISTQKYSSDLYGGGLQGSASKRNGAVYDVMLDNILTYKRLLGSDHNINATLLYGWNKRSGESTSAEGTIYSNLDLSYHNLGSATNQRISSSAWDESYLYQMGRSSYDFRSKYFLTATGRRDGFSGFSQKNKFGIFPSVGIGWMLSEERFIANLNKVEMLKIRASYGATGNLTSRYSSLAMVSSGPSYVFGDGSPTATGQTVESLQNDDLTWEKTLGVNVGLDFQLIDNRISGSIDYFRSTTTDLLWDLTLPSLTGFENIRTNLGRIVNSGFEVVLNERPITGKAFSWDISVNYSSNKNEIIELIGVDNDGDGREDDLVSEKLFIGESIGTVYDYEIDGIWQIGDDIPKGYFPGSYRLVDLDGNGEITPDDRKILGREEPAYTFGIQNTLSYRNFSFRFFIKGIQGAGKGYMRANNPYRLNSTSLAQNTNWFTEIDYWSPSNPDAVYSIPGRDAPIEGRRYFARDFVRLQDVSLAFSIGEKNIKKIGLQSLKIFVSGKNLFTLTDWQGWDPETGQGIGLGTSSLPLMKAYTVGLDISL